MADHSTSAPSRGTRPTRRLIAAGIIRRTQAAEAAAREHRVAALHRACDADYADAAPARDAQNHRVPGLYGTGAVTR